MTDTIPDHVGREAVRLLTENGYLYEWPKHIESAAVITVAKLLMNPPAPMTDPDEEAAERMLEVLGLAKSEVNLRHATEQMRKEREAWEAGR